MKIIVPPNIRIYMYILLFALPALGTKEGAQRTVRNKRTVMKWKSTIYEAKWRQPSFYYGGNADENGRELITFRDVLTFMLLRFGERCAAKSRGEGGRKSGRVARNRIKTNRNVGYARRRGILNFQPSIVREIKLRKILRAKQNFNFGRAFWIKPDSKTVIDHDPTWLNIRVIQ